MIPERVYGGMPLHIILKSLPRFSGVRLIFSQMGLWTDSGVPVPSSNTVVGSPRQVTWLVLLSVLLYKTRAVTVLISEVTVSLPWGNAWKALGQFLLAFSIHLAFSFWVLSSLFCYRELQMIKGCTTENVGGFRILFQILIFTFGCCQWHRLYETQAYYRIWKNNLGNWIL